jgi:uncharacterized protein
MTDDTQGADRDFVEHVVKQLVSDPDSVTVVRTVDEMGVLITLEVSKEDMGKIIGKNGQTAKALRVLLRVIGSKNNARVNLKIVEPEGSEGPPPTMDESSDPGPEAPEASEESAPEEDAPSEEVAAE